MKLTTLQLSQVTNRGFLEHVFGTLDRGHTGHNDVFLSSIVGDPANPPYGYPRSSATEPDANNFFCVSRLNLIDGMIRRTPSAFKALHLIVVDDIETKIHAVDVYRVLGSPSYELETSPNNYQFGYIFEEPITDRAQAEGLVNALCRRFTADVAGVNRLVRLPVGVNSKPKYGDPPPRCRLTYFDPAEMFDPTDLAFKLDAQPEDYKVHESKPFLPADKDPVIEALSNAGLDPRSTATAGTYKITCPWVLDHTDHRDDGSAYIAPAGFKCFHGHCSKKTFFDLRTRLGLSMSEVDDAAAVASKEAYLSADLPASSTVEGESDSPDESPADRIDRLTEEWCGSTFSHIMRPGNKIDWSRIPDRQWLFKDLIQLNAPWYVAGEGGVGKSRLGMALCMAIASGKPFGSFVPDPAGFPVVFLSQEDDDIDKMWRFATQFERWDDNDPWNEEEGDRLRENLMVPKLRFGQKADDEIREIIAGVGSKKGEIRLILWDPLVMFWDEGERGENSINSSSGTVATFRKLIQIARQDNEFWSVGMLHHLNKESKTYGSAMITAQSRACFSMTLEEESDGDVARKIARLELFKVNSSPLLGFTERYDLHPQNGALWPCTPRFLGSHAHIIAGLLRSAEFEWDRAQKDIATACEHNTALGKSPTERVANVRDVLGEWGSTEKDIEAEFGVCRAGSGRRARFRPIEGWLMPTREEL